MERRYRELVDSLDVIVWEAELDPWRHRFMSQQAAQLLGGSVDRFVDSDALAVARAARRSARWSRSIAASWRRAPRSPAATTT